jgi:hypothetical protein
VKIPGKATVKKTVFLDVFERPEKVGKLPTSSSLGVLDGGGCSKLA